VDYVAGFLVLLVVCGTLGVMPLIWGLPVERLQIMSTTHKATPYARTYNADNGTGFRSIDYPLGYSLGLEIAEALGEWLTDLGENASSDLSEIIHGAVDSVMPAYYSDILREWQDAGCPESGEYDFGKGIWAQMTAGLYEAMYDFASGVVYTEDDDIPSALERLNTIYPPVTD
jgi:hypothetical protein